MYSFQDSILICVVKRNLYWLDGVWVEFLLICLRWAISLVYLPILLIIISFTKNRFKTYFVSCKQTQRILLLKVHVMVQYTCYTSFLGLFHSEFYTFSSYTSYIPALTVKSVGSKCINIPKALIYSAYKPTKENTSLIGK